MLRDGQTVWRDYMRISGALVGLGNPGNRYEHTRHNCGFDFLDMLLDMAARDGTLERLSGKRFSCELWKIGLTALPGAWLCAKPMTYMNESGNCVRPLLDYYRLADRDLCVIHDELDLPPGELRFKLGGGNAGHNGLKSISACLASNDYYRLRIGIGRPENRTDMTGWVLSRPDHESAMLTARAMREGLGVLETFTSQGLEKAVCRARRYKGA